MQALRAKIMASSRINHFSMENCNTEAIRASYNKAMQLCHQDNVEKFKEISEYLCELYKRKNDAYGNSFGETYDKLGLISAITRISDKYNRIVNLATNPKVDNIGESIADTLLDLAAYSIMTLIEYNKNNNQQIKYTFL